MDTISTHLKLHILHGPSMLHIDFAEAQQTILLPAYSDLVTGQRTEQRCISWIFLNTVEPFDPVLLYSSLVYGGTLRPSTSRGSDDGHLASTFGDARYHKFASDCSPCRVSYSEDLLSAHLRVDGRGNPIRHTSDRNYNKQIHYGPLHQLSASPCSESGSVHRLILESPPPSSYPFHSVLCLLSFAFSELLKE